MNTNIHFLLHLAQFFLEKELFQICRKNQNTRFMFNNFFSKVMPLIWKRGKRLVETDSPQMTIWCTLISRWIPKDTNTQSEYVILISFPQQQYF